LLAAAVVVALFVAAVAALVAIGQLFPVSFLVAARWPKLL
jgi:hypothetical protein